MKTKLLVALALWVPVFAQTTIKDALVKHWKTTADFTMAVAQAMPADSYNFRPTPEEMSFGQLMIHIGSADLNACAIASGKPRPTIPPNISQAGKEGSPEASKDNVVEFLTSSFDFCNQAVASITAERLNEIVGPENRKMTAFEWLWAYFTHTAHHRGQAEVYLRLKGIKPPPYVF